MSFLKIKKKKTHKNQTYKIKILQAWESQTSISNRLKIIKMLHGSRHFDAHGDNGGNSSKRNDEETDCKTEKSNQNPISRVMTEDS